jgi:hypothetical protein
MGARKEVGVEEQEQEEEQEQQFGRKEGGREGVVGWTTGR